MSKRAQDALISIMSPHIQQFLEQYNFELLIKYYQKQRNISAALQRIAQALESSEQSVFPNTFKDGKWSCNQLNFQQAYNLVQVGANLLNISGDNQNMMTSTANSLLVQSQWQGMQSTS